MYDTAGGGTLRRCRAICSLTTTSPANAPSSSSRSKGHDSPLRHGVAIATCASGGHEIWWIVDALSVHDALALLPFYVAQRTIATAVAEVRIP
jgi:hypothetical protein